MGKGRDPHQEATEHVSRPLSTLKDPASFGPPPKNANYHGGTAVPNKVTPNTRSWGAPLTQEEMLARRAEEEAAIRAAEEEANPPPAPPVPYRVDTTGLSTSHLPPPPAMRVDLNEMKEANATTKPKPKPSLPPRLPPRQNSNPTEFTPAPPPSYDTSVQNPTSVSPQLNQGAINRLGQAGVSVPGFNIGESNPWKNEPSSRNTTTAPTNNFPQLGGLQSRFAKMSTSQNQEPPTQGTTWEQKQAALKTANSFQKDPSSVSLSDARTAASTANNFRERHGTQVASGIRAANNLNDKYGITKRLNSFASQHSVSSTEQATAPAVTTSATPASPPPDMTSIAKKKHPPPPPPKKPNFASPRLTPSPPPLPMGTKPRP
jgi:hypothetical protein